MAKQSTEFCPDDCECLGRMMSICFARPLESPCGKGWTDKIPVVANLKRYGDRYIKQDKCHYEVFRPSKDMFNVKITRKEFLRLPVETRRRILSEDVNLLIDKDKRHDQ
jgi:hypothetical protein